MNSSLQCLSNTTPLTDYFLQKLYVTDCDYEGINPLSLKGLLANEYYNLIQELWGSKRGVVDPFQFKGALSQFAPQFSGYRQQDSQELLSFLLDGLHEDLNKV